MTRGAALLAALLLAACGGPPSTAPEKPAAPVESAVVTPAPPPRAGTAKLPPPKTPLDAYKRELAQRILDANATHTFAGRPPEILGAVVVLQLTIDRNGKVTGLKTLRSRHPPQEKVAHSSVRAAAPFPAPPTSLLRRGTLEIAETWLFRDDGKFQVRSLAEVQAAAD
jgi:protein TonB